MSEMREDRHDGCASREFPPCSVKTILVWILVSMAASYAVGAMFGALLAFVNAWLDLGLTQRAGLYAAFLISHPVWLAGVLTFVVMRLRHTPFSLAHIWVSHRLKMDHIVSGVLLGLLLFAAHALMEKLANGHTIPPPALYSPILDWRVALGAELAIYVAASSIVEEILYRGLLYRALRARMVANRAALTSAAVFAAMHIGPMTDVVGVTGVFLLGIAAARQLERTESLNICVILHSCYNASWRLMVFFTHIIPD